MAGTEDYQHAKFHLDPYNRLATIDIGPKIGGLPSPFGEGELGPHRVPASVGVKAGMSPLPGGRVAGNTV